jgi:hypothetical protein
VRQPPKRGFVISTRDSQHSHNNKLFKLQTETGTLWERGLRNGDSITAAHSVFTCSTVPGGDFVLCRVCFNVFSVQVRDFSEN